MIVVADASPLNYLIQIECDWVLPVLYGRILVPDEVMHELAHAAAPVPVRQWTAVPPAWLEVVALTGLPAEADGPLDLGELKALQLCAERGADLLLIDERKGSAEAKRRGIETTGTLGVLLAAGEQGLLDSRDAYSKLLRATTFRISTGLEQHFLRALETLGRQH